MALFSDTHYWPEHDNFVTSDGSIQLQGWSSEILTLLVKEITAHPVDCGIHLGDMTCGGGTYQMPHHEFDQAIRQLFDALQAAPAPVFGLPGNHDCLSGGGDWRAVETLWGLGAGYGRTIDLPQARLVLLNAQGHSPAMIEEALPSDPIYGWVHHGELARLDHALATAGSRPAIVLMHQVLVPWLGDRPWKEYYGVRNAGAVLEILARYENVRAVFQGHAHRLDVREVDLAVITGSSAQERPNRRCPFIIVPSLIEYPVAWLKLTLRTGALHLAMQPLPLPAADLSRDSGTGQAWRSGRPEWQNLTISLL